MLNLISILVFLIGSTASGIPPVERQIAASPVECAAGWNADGELAFERCGDSASEFIVSPAEGIAVLGGVFTHSHPALDDCWTLSIDDMYWAALAGVREMRAVSVRNGVLRVAVTDGALVFRTIDRAVVEAFIKQEQALKPDHCAYLDAAWRVLARRYGFTYFVLTE